MTLGGIVKSREPLEIMDGFSWLLTLAGVINEATKKYGVFDDKVMEDIIRGAKYDCDLLWLAMSDVEHVGVQQYIDDFKVFLEKECESKMGDKENRLVVTLPDFNTIDTSAIEARVFEEYGNGRNDETKHNVVASVKEKVNDSLLLVLTSNSFNTELYKALFECCLAEELAEGFVL